MHIQREKHALTHADRGTCACTLTEADTGRHPYTETRKGRHTCDREGETSMYPHRGRHADTCTDTDGDAHTHRGTDVCTHTETLRFIQT